MKEYSKIVEACQYLLNNYPEAQKVKSYLDHRINQKSQESFQLGYFPNIKNIKVLIDLVGLECLQKLQLITTNSFQNELIKNVHFDNQPLIIPLKNPYGEIVGLSGRSILPDKEIKNNNIAKYKNTPRSNFFKKGHLLFGLYENKKSILKHNSVYLVEGQFDVIKATEKGLTNTVGLGTSDMTYYQFSVINRYTDNLILILDNDSAGENGRKHIINKFGKFANIQNFYIPDQYKDIDEYLNTKSDNDKSMSFIIK